VSFKKIKTNFLISVAKIIAMFPLDAILKIGASIGYLTWLIPNKRKKIATRNIVLCFPDLSNKHQRSLVKENLISTGIGFAEMIISFWSKTDKFIHRFDFEGLEYVESALKRNKGCILLSCHIHSIELASRAINTQLNNPAFILGRQHNNKIFETHVDNARRKHCEKTIDKKDLRSVLKAFKENRFIFYIPDQNFSYHCEYIDFFKQPAATVIAPVKISQTSQAAVVPWFCFREKNKWKIQFHPPLDYFYTEDMTCSLTRMNQLFEAQIKKYPEQYLWVHRRFKNHPKGKNYLYKDL
jgi:KDO2-lipid IV(A) lauroyltransferase